MIQKKALVIQDISAIGRVSMMAVLPILSGAGIHTSCLPTALLSTHSGEFQDFSFLDLTDEMGRILEHWKKEKIIFDAAQTGYLGSPEQIAVVAEAMRFVRADGLRIIDPVMADQGKLYSGISGEMVDAMRRLCKHANILLPNLTEASLLAGEEYEDRHDDVGYIREMLWKLHEKIGTQKIVLTGVSSRAGYYGAVCFDAQEGSTTYFEQKKVEDHFYGTGDIFAGVLSAGLLNDKSLEESTDIATEFTQRAILMSAEQNLPRRFGICFEKNIPWLIRRLGFVSS